MARTILLTLLLASALLGCGAEPIRPNVRIDQPATETLATPYPVAVVEGRTEHAEALVVALKTADRELTFEVGVGRSLVFLATPENAAPIGLEERIRTLKLGDATTVGKDGDVAVVTLGEADGQDLASIVQRMADAGGELRFLIQVLPTAWPDDAVSFDAFKTEEVKAYLAARREGVPYVPTREGFVVRPRIDAGEAPSRTEHFEVFEWPKNADQRMDGSWVENAVQSIGETGRPVVTYEVVKDRRDQVHAWTERNVGRPMAIVLDGRVLAAPTIQSPLRDRVQVTLGSGSSFAETRREAATLAAALRLKAGAVPAALAVAATWRDDGTFEIVVPVAVEDIRLTLGAVDAAERESPRVSRILRRRANVDTKAGDAAAALLASIELGLLEDSEAADQLRPFEDAGIHALAERIYGANAEATPVRRQVIAARLLPRVGLQSDAVLDALVLAATRAAAATVRGAGVAGLAELAPARPEVRGKLLPALDDEDPHVRRLAASTLLEHAEDGDEILTLLLPRAARDPDALLMALHAFAERHPERALDALVRESGHEEAPRRRVAALLLGSLRDLRARDTLLVLVEDADVEVRRSAASALAYRQQVLNDGAPDVSLAEVERRMASEHLEARAWALSSLGAYGEAAREHIETLRGLLDDPEEMIRASAAWSLVRLGEKDEKARKIVDELMIEAERSER